MNNLEQGSAGISLASSALELQQPTPQTTHFLEMARAALANREQPAQVTELLQPAKPTWQPLHPKPKGPEGFMGLLGLESLEEYEAYKKAQERPYMPAPPPLEDLLDIEVLRPKRGSRAKTEGAGALARFFDAKARVALAERPDLYTDGVPPAQIVVHLPAEAIQETLGICSDTRRQYTAQLNLMGYLHHHPHITQMTKAKGDSEGECPESIDAMDGTLYAIRLTPGHLAKIPEDAYGHEYRNLDADRKTGNTAYNLILNAYRSVQDDPEKPLPALEKNSGGHKKLREMCKILKAGLAPEQLRVAREKIDKGLEMWVVSPGRISDKQSPLIKDDPRSFMQRITKQLSTLQDAIYTVDLLIDCPYKARPDLVGALADVLSKHLDNGKNHGAFCTLLWQAYKAGRTGLDCFVRVLRRVMVAHRECDNKNRPRGGLLTKWWRAEMEQSGVGWLNASD